MKSIPSYLISFFFLISMSGLQAQISIGVNAGVSFSTFSYGQEDDLAVDDFLQIGYTPGLSVSVPIEFPLKGPFSLQTELNYLQKGMNSEFEFFEDEQNYTNFKNRNILNYFQIPVLLKAKTGKGAFRASAYAGPAISFLGSGKSYSRVDGLIFGESFLDENEASIDLDDELKRWEISAIIGVGLELDAGPGAITLDLRYQQGFSNLITDSEFKVYNRGITSALGYKLKF